MTFHSCVVAMRIKDNLKYPVVGPLEVVNISLIISEQPAFEIPLLVKKSLVCGHGQW